MIQFSALGTIAGCLIGAWCNGSTADFESVDPGSNPGAPAETLHRCPFIAIFCVVHAGIYQERITVARRV